MTEAPPCTHPDSIYFLNHLDTYCRLCRKVFRLRDKIAEIHAGAGRV